MHALRRLRSLIGAALLGLGLTGVGIAAVLLGAALLVSGLILNWPAFILLGGGFLACALIGLIWVLRPSSLVIDRTIQPPRVPKGSTAIAVLAFANRSRRTVGITVAHQPFGNTVVRTVIPRVRRGERGMRTYRLPTRQRGIFDVGPLEVTRRDPFELFRTSRRFGGVERIWVYPRIVGLRTLPSGQRRHLEGPSSDASPQGNVTFHRLRDYAVGDDLRLVHWRASARTGTLVVKHNVDTSQPYTVVVLNLDPAAYTPESFEEAVDVAASVIVTNSGSKAPVELRLSNGTIIGGPRVHEPTPLIDHLTGVESDATGSLRSQLLTLRRARGGTALVVVTGRLQREDLPYITALRRRYDQLLVVSIDPSPREALHFPGVVIITAPDADAACAAWNLQVAS